MVLLYLLLGVLALFLLYVVFLFVCSLFIDTKKEYSHNSAFYRFLLNSASMLALKVLRIRVQTTGLDKLSLQERPLFVCNHRSNFDPIITWCVLQKWQPAFVSKAENFRVPIFGKFIRKCCFMAIDRENPRKAMETINRAAQLLQAGEVSVGIYPEGTRSKSGELLPFHNGVFKIAQKADKPIAVLSISGTEKISKNIKKGKSSPVRFHVLEVIPAHTVKELRTGAIGDCVRKSIENDLKQQEKKKEG